tara:strand:- start:44 stop:520 length:477 start_codon:yes stop_codon:yes gene_type:complete
MDYYNKIRNPENGRWVSLYSKKGKNILKMYLRFINGGAEVNNLMSGEKALEVHNLEDLDKSLENLKNNDKAMVNFYADWCGHCQNFKDDYDKIANNFNNNSHVNIIKVDASKNKEVAEKYGVNGFPTLKIFRKNDNKLEKEDYENKRDVETIVNLLKN